MPKVKFKATEKRPAYNGQFSFKDGEVKEVPEVEAKRLVKDFPDSFEIIEEEKAMKPKRNRLMKPSKNK